MREPFSRHLLILAAAAVAALVVIWALPPKESAEALVGAVLVALVFRYPVVGFVLLVFSVPWTSGMAAGGAISPTEIVVAILGVVWLARAVVERTNPLTGAPWTPYLVLFLVAIALSVTQATDLLACAREIIKWGEMAAVYLAGVALIRRTSQVALVLAAYAIGGLTQALLGYYQSILSVGPAAFAAERIFLRAYGSFDQPNPYAGYLNMVLPMALAFALIGPKRMRGWAWLTTVLLLGAVLASESRGALLAGVTAIALMLACVSVPARRLVWIGILGLLLAGWAASLGLSLGPLQTVLNGLGFGAVDFGNVTNANFSEVERAAHWLAGVRMFAAHPFLGVGIGNYGAAYPAYHPRGWYASLDHAHNYYINIAAEAGILGLAAYLLMIGSALWYSSAAMRLAQDRMYRAAGLGLFGALIATSFHNIFDVLFVHGTTALIGLLMAIASRSLVLAASPAGNPAVQSVETG